MHHAYHISGMTDLDVIRTQALRRYNDDRWPDETTIHHHSYGEKCQEVESDTQRHDVINDSYMQELEDKLARSQQGSEVESVKKE